MKITNHQQLPEPLYQAIVQQSQAHSVGDADISCTQLIDSPLIAWLWRNDGARVEEDASVYPVGGTASHRLWALYGSVAHKILEGYQRSQGKESQRVPCSVEVQRDRFH